MPNNSETKASAPTSAKRRQPWGSLGFRRVKNHLATVLTVAAAVIVISPLLAIFAYLVIRGTGSINLAFLTHAPAPIGEKGGGVGNAIAGSAIILAIASFIGVPLGIGSGIYLSEYGRNRLGNVVRFTADVLNEIGRAHV